MKKLYKIKNSKVFMIAASLVIAVSGFAGSKASFAYTNSELAEALSSYKTILDNVEVTDRYGLTAFSIADLNGDGMPELICDEDGSPVTKNDFYTFRDGKAVKLNANKMQVARYGSYMISPERKSFCIYRGGPATTEGMPYEYTEFEIKNDVIVEKNDYYGNKNPDGSWKCVDKSGKISYEEFKKVADSFKSVSSYQNNESNRVVRCNPDRYLADAYSWKSDGSGWWYGDTAGNYVSDKWLEIENYWYYFKTDGYMATGEWIGGWWLNADGTCTYSGVASWKSDGSGWWYEDTSGWYAKSEWQKIDGSWYYFEASGYMATNKYVDGWWCGADGVCQ